MNEMTDGQINDALKVFACAVIGADRTIQDARHLEELRAYALTVSNLRAELHESKNDAYRLGVVADSWLRANSPGGWIDALRSEIAGFEAGCAEESQIGIRMRQEMIDLKAECVRLKAELAGRGVPDGWRTAIEQTLSDWKNQVNTLASLAGSERRERTIGLKQEIADMLSDLRWPGASPPRPALCQNCERVVAGPCNSVDCPIPDAATPTPAPPKLDTELIGLAKPETCKWTEDAGDMWQSSCGSAWAFTDGGPAENVVKFCHGCGKPVEIVEAP